MKRLTVFWVSLVAIVMGFTACNNDADEPDNGSRFAFDADNRCYLPGVKTITYDEINAGLEILKKNLSERG